MVVHTIPSVNSKGFEAALAIEANVLADTRTDVENAPKAFAARKVDNGLGKRRVKVVVPPRAPR